MSFFAIPLRKCMPCDFREIADKMNALPCCRGFLCTLKKEDDVVKGCLHILTRDEIDISYLEVAEIIADLEHYRKKHNLNESDLLVYFTKYDQFWVDKLYSTYTAKL